MGANNTRLSPRQKMINLMYIVLTAMLALNVSSDVLDGFVQVHEGLRRTNNNMGNRNDGLYRELERFTADNPEKGQVWLDKAMEVRELTSALSSFVDSCKLAIVHKADGENGDPNNIINRDDLEAASVVMLPPGGNLGKTLRERVDVYRDYVTAIFPDSLQRFTIGAALSTTSTLAKGTLTPQTWEETQFEQKPAIAAVTLLTKLQNDILYAEGMALQSLLSQVDAGDLRVNELNAFVIPESRIVMRGSPYKANIVLAAVDTASRPQIFVGGHQLPGGLYQTTATSPGNFSYSGYINVPRPDGTVSQHKFESSYTVIEPTATVSATMMNVLYAGIDNPISISVPGIPMSSVSASMTNGTLTRNGDTWIARPSAVGTDAVITVTADQGGHPSTVATMTFRVRKLPDPTPFITYNDGKALNRYKGGKPFPKTMLLSSPGLEAAIDDGLLDTKFKVLSFETVFFDQMGNAMPEVSNGAAFSERQRQQLQRLSRGKRFYISRIRAVGPDGITRDLSPMEVIIN